MNQKNAWIILIFFSLTILLRKIGFGFSAFLIEISGLILCFTILTGHHFFKNHFRKISLSIFLIISIAILQYWLPSEAFLDKFWFKKVPLNALVFATWVFFMFFIVKDIRSNILTITICLLISFILFTFLILDPRQFHNFYRSSLYEEFIRSKYPEQSGDLADLYIDKYKRPDKEKAEKYLKSAIDAEGLFDYEMALELYNKSIDLNPDNPFSCYRRGLLKLTRLDLNSDVSYSAIKDFSRTLRLDSTYTVAYFHRSLALGYLGLRMRSFQDMKKVWELDSVLTEDEFQKKYGTSKKSFSKPFHP